MLHPSRIRDHLRHLGPDAGAEADAGSPRRWWALGVLSLAVAIGQLDLTIVNVALPSISHDLGASTSQLQWVMDAYTVTLAGFLLLGGGLADRFGRRRVFIIGLAVFGIASMAGAAASSAGQLIAARAVMGLGAALFFPPTLSLLAVIFPPSERARAVALWSITGGVATSLGPIVGGFLVDNFWWGSALLVNVPVVVVAVGGAVVLLPRSTRPGAPAPDNVGAILSLFGLSAVIFAIIEGPGAGWTSALIVTTLTVGLLLVVAFVLWEARHEDPMVDVTVFRLPGVAAGGLCLVVAVLTMAAALFLVPLYLQSVQGRSAMMVGVLLVPFGATFAIAATMSDRLPPRLGLRATLVLGLVVSAIGMAGLALVDGPAGLVSVVVGGAVFGLGGAIIAPTATTTVMNALPTAKAGDASAVSQITRQVGGAFGVALAGTILSAAYTRRIAPALATLPSDDATTASASITGAQDVAGRLSTGSAALLEHADAAFATGFRVAMLVPATLCLATAVLVVIVLDRRHDGNGSGDRPDEATAGAHDPDGPS